MTNIKQQIIEDFRGKFVSSDEENIYDAYPYNIKPSIHEEITKFLLSSQKKGKNDK